MDASRRQLSCQEDMSPDLFSSLPDTHSMSPNRLKTNFSYLLELRPELERWIVELFSSSIINSFALKYLTVLNKHLVNAHRSKHKGVFNILSKMIPAKKESNLREWLERDLRPMLEYLGSGHFRNFGDLEELAEIGNMIDFTLCNIWKRGSFDNEIQMYDLPYHFLEQIQESPRISPRHVTRIRVMYGPQEHLEEQLEFRLDPALDRIEVTYRATLTIYEPELEHFASVGWAQAE